MYIGFRAVHFPLFFYSTTFEIFYTTGPSAKVAGKNETHTRMIFTPIHVPAFAGLKLIQE
jgi:hypothetical protein